MALAPTQGSGHLLSNLRTEERDAMELLKSNIDVKKERDARTTMSPLFILSIQPWKRVWWPQQILPPKD